MILPRKQTNHTLARMWQVPSYQPTARTSSGKTNCAQPQTSYKQQLDIEFVSQMKGTQEI
jgi:hypothetical protein